MGERTARVTITLTIDVPFDDDDTCIAHPWPRCRCGELWSPCLDGALDVPGAVLIESDVEWVEIDDCLCSSPGGDGEGGIVCHCDDEECKLRGIGND
jgi:hypothetical protein